MMVSEKNKKKKSRHYQPSNDPDKEEMFRTQYYSVENEAKVRELSIQDESLRLTAVGAEKQRSKTLPQGHTVTDWPTNAGPSWMG